MLTVDEYGRIRRAHRDGMSIRQLARTLHHSRCKIRRVLAEPEPKPYVRSRPNCPKLGRFHGVIDQILTDDEKAPPKQRHTAMQVFRRLVAEHGYRGGYDAVRRYIGKVRGRQRPTFIPLNHDPGQRQEADFGHIYVDFPDGCAGPPILGRPFALAKCLRRSQLHLLPSPDPRDFPGGPYANWCGGPPLPARRAALRKLLRSRLATTEIPAERAGESWWSRAAHTHAGDEKSSPEVQNARVDGSAAFQSEAWAAK
jgi:hypothetical protein